MARKPNTQPTDLVMMNLGYWGKFVMPVEAAANIMTTLIKSGAQRIDSTHIGDLGTMYFQVKNDVSIGQLDGHYDPDIPSDSDLREPYVAWLKAKASLVGKGYKPEPYQTYLDSVTDVTNGG